jgi:hypothetical protein
LHAWTTVVFNYDGLFTFSVEVDGQVAATFDGSLRPLMPPKHISIGGQIDGTDHWPGRIDDVKVWRLDPTRIDHEFGSRPVDDAVERCWAQWRRQLDAVRRANPECSDTVTALLGNALAATMAQLYQTGAYNRPEFINAVVRYRDLWAQGRLSEIPAVLADLIAWLNTLGFDPLGDADVQALLTDGCAHRFFGQLTLDCDADFIDMINGVAL